MVSMPQVVGDGQVDFYGPPPPQARPAALGNGNGGGGVKRRRLSNGFQTANKRVRTVAPPPPPPPAYNSVCVEDVGQGNCNLLIDGANEPRFYYDVGYPLWFY